MTWRLYLMPLSGSGISHLDPRTAKYRGEFGESAWALMDYGKTNYCLVAANLTTEQEALVIAHADVRQLPENLDTALTQTQVNATKTFLEAADIPAQWVARPITWRQVLRTVCGLFLFAQRLHAISNIEFRTTGLSWDMTFAELPAAARDGLLATADSFGYDYSSLSGSSTLRQVAKFLADQWGSQEIRIMEFVI